jgi:hypothetical protein
VVQELMRGQVRLPPRVMVVMVGVASTALR